MQSKIIQKILAKQGEENLFDFLSKKLSGSEFNSLMMEVFNRRTEAIQPAALLENYRNNRFVGRTDFDPIELGEYELSIMKEIRNAGFEVMDFSPVAPLGACSALGTVDQKKIISATRNTEVVSDITNVIALEIAKQKKENRYLNEIKAGASFRHIRGQKFDLPGFTPYFKIVCLVSSGRDKGNYQFEIQSIIDHIETYYSIFKNVLNISSDHLETIVSLPGDTNISTKKNALEQNTSIPIKVLENTTTENHYYQNFKITIKLHWKGQTYEIIDGGEVNWTHKLLQNKKERMIISGMGSEFLFRLMRNN